PANLISGNPKTANLPAAPVPNNLRRPVKRCLGPDHFLRKHKI
ncbi:hypothetical protein ABIE69_003180, partial [Rhodobacteraceae bacterium MBR-64]